MYINLFGEAMLSREDYAEGVVKLLRNRTFLRMKREFDLEKDVAFSLYDDKDQKVSVSRISGLYCIFRVKFDKTEFLYSGKSDSNVQYRLYRFLKELENKSRSDEDHPAARRARQNGITSNDFLYVQVLPKQDILSEFGSYYYNLYPAIDDYIAESMRSYFNSKCKERVWDINPKNVWNVCAN